MALSYNNLAQSEIRTNIYRDIKPQSEEDFGVATKRLLIGARTLFRYFDVMGMSSWSPCVVSQEDVQTERKLILGRYERPRLRRCQTHKVRLCSHSVQGSLVQWTVLLNSGAALFQPVDLCEFARTSTPPLCIHPTGAVQKSITSRRIPFRRLSRSRL